MCPCFLDYDSIGRMLISFGADVDAPNAYGNTPVHISCLNGHLSVLQDLAEAGADLESINFRGQTPLHLAAASAHGADCLTYLLTQEVDVNKQSSDGRTPLHMTALHGRFSRSKPLIDKGKRKHIVQLNHVNVNDVKIPTNFRRSRRLR